MNISNQLKYKVFKRQKLNMLFFNVRCIEKILNAHNFLNILDINIFKHKNFSVWNLIRDYGYRVHRGLAHYFIILNQKKYTQIKINSIQIFYFSLHVNN